MYCIFSVTGYMFGKGIYFADVVSKSANYCLANATNNIGLLLLCEVALGNMKNLRVANHKIVDIPNETWQSVKGCGVVTPKMWTNWHMPEGVFMPFSQLSSQLSQTALQYNEYIVYNPAQVRIRYLFKMKFNYKWINWFEIIMEPRPYIIMTKENSTNLIYHADYEPNSTISNIGISYLSTYYIWKLNVWIIWSTNLQ